jgi:hypothetical protein
MAVFWKWWSIANGGLLQMAVFCKWRSFANGGPLQMAVLWRFGWVEQSINMQTVSG